MTNGRLVELTRDWSVDQPARPPAHPSRLSTLVTGEPVNVFITGAQGADGNIIIANKEIYRQLVFTSSATLSGLWGDTGTPHHSSTHIYGSKYLMKLLSSGRQSQPQLKVKSVEMMLINNSNKLKLVCRVKSKDHQTTQISWLKDGVAVEEVEGKIKMKKRR